MKVAIITALLGNRDQLNPQPQINGVDWICYSDKERESDTYNVVQVPDLFHDPMKTSRLFKLMPHLFLPSHDVVIWHDANFIFNDVSFIKSLIEKTAKNDLIIPAHYKRNCIYQEAQWAINKGKDTTKSVDQTIAFLQAEKYPRNNGLVNAGLIARNNLSERVKAFNLLWWNIYQNFSKRDQLSFNYVAWKLNFAFEELPLNVYNNPYFKVLAHQK